MDDQHLLVSLAPRRGAAANSGVFLTRGPAGWIAVPRPHTPLPSAPKAKADAVRIEPRLLPRIPLAQFQYWASWLRSYWATHQSCAAWALYLNMSTGKWRGEIPPQIVAGDDVRMDLNFTGYSPPPANHRLAGSFRSISSADPAAVVDTLPAIDGLHMIVHAPCEWLGVSAFVRAEGIFTRMPVANLLFEPPVKFEPSLYSRIRNVTAL